MKKYIINNFKEFKELILSNFEDILNSDNPEAEGWRADSNCCGDWYYVWDGFGLSPFNHYIENIKELDQEFINQLLKCETEFADPDYSNFEKAQAALDTISWELADMFSHLPKLKQDLIYFEKKLKDYINDRPDPADYDDRAEYEEAEADYQYWLEDKQADVANAEKDLNNAWDQFYKDFGQLDISAFYK